MTLTRHTRAASLLSRARDKSLSSVWPQPSEDLQLMPNCRVTLELTVGTSGRRPPLSTSSKLTHSSMAPVGRVFWRRSAPTATLCGTTLLRRSLVYPRAMEQFVLTSNLTLAYTDMPPIWTTSMPNSHTFSCPVCGFGGLSEPAY